MEANGVQSFEHVNGHKECACLRETKSFSTKPSSSVNGLREVSAATSDWVEFAGKHSSSANYTLGLGLAEREIIWWLSDLFFFVIEIYLIRFLLMNYDEGHFLCVMPYP